MNLAKNLENGLEKAHFGRFGTLKIAKNGLENLEKTLKMASKNCGNPDKKVSHTKYVFFMNQKFKMIKL